jgi:hypothetical protein
LPEWVNWQYHASLFFWMEAIAGLSQYRCNAVPTVAEELRNFCTTSKFYVFYRGKINWGTRIRT